MRIQLANYQYTGSYAKLRNAGIKSFPYSVKVEGFGTSKTKGSLFDFASVSITEHFEKDKYGKSKILSMDEDFDINNIRNDYFVSIETDDLAVVVGGNEMNFFTKDEKINDDILKELSNRWMLYCLQYHLKRNIINKDSMCEKHEY